MREALGLHDDADARALAQAFGRGLWNAMPLPGNDFRPKPLPASGRNDACPCGSGRKFKRCCGTGPARLVYLDLAPGDERAATEVAHI